jgi:xanthine dehydrogenase YagR molybdenum-binding subunit
MKDREERRNEGTPGEGPLENAGERSEERAEQGDQGLLAGFPGLSRRVDLSRKNPNDAPPWSLETKFRVVGTDVPRLDGMAKATGVAVYPSDFRPKGLLFAAILRSPIPKGRVAEIDTSKAETAPGVMAVAIATKKGRQLRYVGQEIIAIAAETRAQAEDALALVQLTLDADEDFVTDPREEAKKRLPKVDPLPMDLKAASAVSRKGGTAEDLVVQLRLSFGTQVQMHHPLEPHGITAWFKEDGSLEVWASTQGTFMMQRSLAQAFRIPPNKVHVLTPVMGGGFGSKLQAGIEARLCAELAMEAGRPVQLFANRRGQALALGNRPSSLHWIRAKADGTGKILDWEAQSFGFPGFAGSGRVAYPTFYKGVRRPRHKDLRGNTGAARAFRAPGHPQGFFAAESMVDELAYRIGMNPMEFRRKNVDPVHRMQIEMGAKAFGWRERFNPRPGQRDQKTGMLRGAGLACTRWGGMGGARARVLCRIHQDGTVEVRNGAQDIGTGTRTILAVVTAETLGIEVKRIRAHIGDTHDPSGPSSGGSTTTPTLAPAIRHAAWLAGRELLDRVAEAKRLEGKSLQLKDGKILKNGKAFLSFAEACRLIGPEPVEAMGQRYRNWRGFAGGVAGCQFAEVEVDPETGLVRVQRILAVHDCGTVLDKKTTESQIIGAVIQGLSYALYEERLVDDKLGRVLGTDFEHYRIAGSLEMPEIIPILNKGCNGHNNTGAAGIGEPPTIPTASAIACAVRNAIGARVHELPLTPDRVLAVLDRVHGEKR